MFTKGGRKMENEKILQLLKTNVLEKNPNVFRYQSLGILKEIGLKENCFGNKTEELMKLVTEDPKTYRNFAILASACCVFMGYSWKCDAIHSHNPHWDERKKASEEFCYVNYDKFLEIFKKHTGFDLPMKELPGYLQFLRDIKLDQRSILYLELCDFANEHSTIQQKMIGSFIRTMAEKENNILEFSDIRFPFI